MAVVDLYLIYSFVKRFVQPFDSWPAYKLGVIDKDGNVLIPKDKRTQAQKDAFGYFDVLICNLKKLVGKVPGGATMTGLTAATLILLRDKPLNEGELAPDELSKIWEKYINNINDLQEANCDILKILGEDAPANCAGGGAVAGIGVGVKGEPGVTPKKKKKVTPFGMFTRKIPK